MIIRHETVVFIPGRKYRSKTTGIDQLAIICQQWARTLFPLVAIVTKFACFFISSGDDFVISLNSQASVLELAAPAELAIYIDIPLKL